MIFLVYTTYSQTTPKTTKPSTTTKPTTSTKPSTTTPKTTPTKPTTTNQPKPSTQTSTSSSTTSTTQSKPSEIEAVWLGGSFGAGAVVSTNIINSGALLPFNGELTFQKKHTRMGIGIANEIYLTPEALGRFILGEGLGVKKFHFIYEVYVFRHFPINLGFSSHMGFFGTGSDSTNSRGGIFLNMGPALEFGVRPVYLFVRPSIEYKNWGMLHHELIATGSVGLRFKFLTDYEIQRRAEKKRERDNKW